MFKFWTVLLSLIGRLKAPRTNLSHAASASRWHTFSIRRISCLQVFAWQWSQYPYCGEYKNQLYGQAVLVSLREARYIYCE
jgi:hypothetical protein